MDILEKNKVQEILLRGFEGATIAPLYKDKDKDKDKDKNKNKNRRKVFKKPTKDEVVAYCKEKGYDIDADYWLSYYESNGWMVGKNKMVSWTATLATWNARNNKSSPKKDKVTYTYKCPNNCKDDKGVITDLDNTWTKCSICETDRVRV